jgi:hypothetical protein
MDARITVNALLPGGQPVAVGVGAGAGVGVVVDDVPVGVAVPPVGGAGVGVRDRLGRRRRGRLVGVVRDGCERDRDADARKQHDHADDCRRQPPARCALVVERQARAALEAHQLSGVGGRAAVRAGVRLR